MRFALLTPLLCFATAGGEEATKLEVETRKGTKRKEVLLKKKGRRGSVGREETARRLDCSSILRTTSRLRKLYTRSRTQTRCCLVVFTRARRPDPDGRPTGAGSSRRRTEGGWHARPRWTGIARLRKRGRHSAATTAVGLARRLGLRGCLSISISDSA